MSCRIQSIKPPCAYAVEGIEWIKLLDFEDFQGYRFLDSGLYDSCYVEEILHSGTFVDIDAPDLVAKYTSSGKYVHRIESFIGDLAGYLQAALHLATKRKFVVVFKTNSGKQFTFGYDAGASLSYTNQTNEGFGSAVIITANSIYPAFEYIGTIETPTCLPLAVDGPFTDDDEAGAGGVTSAELYGVSLDNIWALPEGVVKLRVSEDNDTLTFDGCTALTVYGAYPDDDEAGVGGVPLNAVYRLSVDNIWGLPTNVLKVRKTGATGAATLPEEIYELSADNIWGLPEGTIKTV